MIHFHDYAGRLSSKSFGVPSRTSENTHASSSLISALVLQACITVQSDKEKLNIDSTVDKSTIFNF